ncbi:DMT family transporter [Streptomyces sp. CB03911]|uniref:DMT family transporter n=1 Tax=Streptomycetaceae TaxID=2062 RepID=UPI00093D949D|nr:DMT family transporter [Streptomyces sp. CB03911]OKI29222.1 hypothetical protein A6A07_23905 [Streptomyces sp. CB03911]
MPLSDSASGALRAAPAMTVLGCSTSATAALADYPLHGAQTLRYLLAAALLLPLARRTGPLRPALGRAELARLALLAATGLFAFNVLMVQALRYSDPAAVGSVIGCTPLLLAVLGPLLARRRPQARLLVAAAVVVAGAAVTQGAGPGGLPGFLYALGTLACEAAFSLLAVGLLPRLGAVRVSAYTTALAVPMFGLTGLLLEGRRMFRMPTSGEGAGLLYLSLVLTVLAFLLWYGALGRLGPERAGLFAGLVPVTAALSGAVLGTAALRPAELLGSVLVGLGVCAGLAVAKAPERARPVEAVPAGR